jgi:hypothetical protein
MMTEAWDTIFTARCSQTLTETEADIWMLEIRRSITGWAHDSFVDGPDPLKGDKVKAINADLCAVIRHTMNQGNPPRADAGRRSARYTVSDLIMWVRLWKKTVRILDDHPDINQTDAMLINMMKPVIVQWADQGRWSDIAFEIPMPFKIHNEGNMPNMTLSKHGQAQLELWVLTEYGMSCRDERRKWCVENYPRLFGKEYEDAELQDLTDGVGFPAPWEGY